VLTELFFFFRTQRPQFKHVVLPRTSGMEIILDAVKDVRPDIYDLTIAFPSYSGEIPTFEMGYDRKTDTDVPSMKSLLAGKSPGQVAVHARKFSYAEAEKDLQKFLDTRWAEKDVRLAHFIKHQKFPVAKNEQHYTFTTPVRFPPSERYYRSQ
jgi:lysocardiolipin and lysophospholipid acyltransferase